MQVKVYRNQTLSEGARIALGARLYVSGWSLHPTLETLSVLLNPEMARIAISYEGTTPVALVLIHIDGMLMAFCRKSERRKGHASACFKALKVPAFCWAGEGVYGSPEFWKSNGIDARPRHRCPRSTW
jgi:hypothetical protein